MSSAIESTVAPRFAAFDIVRIALGLVMLFAAATKGYQLATEPVLGEGLLNSRWLLIGVVEFELFFGLWLLSGIRPTWSWIVAVSCFAIFGSVSFTKAVLGEANCGCFGKMHVNPWITFCFSATVLAVLLRWRPATPHRGTNKVLAPRTDQSGGDLVARGNTGRRIDDQLSSGNAVGGGRNRR